jgi:histidinol dehydrogenase
MKIIDSAEFDDYWRRLSSPVEDEAVNAVVREVIAAVRAGGEAAVRDYAARFDRACPARLETPPERAKAAWDALEKEEPALASALEFARDRIEQFALEQKKQFADFETCPLPGLFTGQRVIPVERAAVYAPAGRFPLISSVLMGVVPAKAAGVSEVILASPPLENGEPDRRILAAAHLAGADRIFAIGGAQAIAALALGAGSVPRADLIAGPGNRYVAAAKRLLYGEVGIDFVAGPTDVLVISDGSPDLIAADLIAQAEHDPEARARALVPDCGLAEEAAAALERRLAAPMEAASASIDAGGLIIVYGSREEACRIANRIAPEHLELQVQDPDAWIPALRNYGSLFIGAAAAEVLGDYSAGLNHTLPTAGSARFTGGLSVRHFLKTVTTLRCAPGSGYEQALGAARTIALAEGLEGHAESARIREFPT